MEHSFYYLTRIFFYISLNSFIYMPHITKFRWKITRLKTEGIACYICMVLHSERCLLRVIGHLFDGTGPSYGLSASVFVSRTPGGWYSQIVKYHTSLFKRRVVAWWWSTCFDCRRSQLQFLVSLGRAVRGPCLKASRATANQYRQCCTDLV